MATAGTASPERQPARNARALQALMAIAQDPSAFRGASRSDPNIGTWRPSLRSADAEIFRDAGQLRARARDLVRNNPTARQAVRISRQGTIGANFRLVLRPDYKFLGLTHEEATRWARMAERVWEQYAHGLSFFVDAGRRHSFSELMALVHDSDFTDGECLVAGEWDDARPWRTCFQVVDVDRLSNPTGRPDSIFLKGGVELDRFGAPTAYHVRQAHPGDVALLGARPWVWDRIARETPWFRPIMMHSFDPQRAGQTRGVSEFATVIHALKRGDDYAKAELENAAVRAGFVAVLTSAINFEQAAAALRDIGVDPSQDEDGDGDPLTRMAMDHLEGTLDYYNNLDLSVNGQKIPKLSPGDDLKFLGNNTPGQGYAEYIKSQLRYVAAGLGVDPVGISQDFTAVNYSSAKMAWAVNGKHHETRRGRLIRTVAMPMVAAFMEEAILDDRLPMPAGKGVKFNKDHWWACRDALVRGTFLCAGAPVIDPLKERQAQQMGVTMGVDTLESIAAGEGEHWEERLEQQARENEMREELGLMPVNAIPLMPLPEEGEDGDGESDGEDKPKKKDGGEDA